MATDRVRPAIDQPLAGLGLSVQDLSVVPAGRRRVVRVVVDRDLAGLAATDTTSRVPPLSLDEIADATRVVSDVLDSDDLMGERPYVLEVTSPGVDRPLRGRNQFRRNVGRLVAVVTDAGDTYTGRIRSVSADEVVLETLAGPRGVQDGAVQGAAKPAGTPARRAVAIGDISSAVVQVEFARSDDVDDEAVADDAVADDAVDNDAVDNDAVADDAVDESGGPS